MSNILDKLNFPYPTLRKGQGEFIKQVCIAIKNNKNILISAPTGLGKTISAIAPALYFAKKNDLSVVVLTSRQTQANQVIKTIKDINSKIQNNDNLSTKEKKLKYLAFIGKRNMCVHRNRDLYPASDFNDFCKKARENGNCIFYKNTRNSDYQEQLKNVISISSNQFLNVEGFIDLAKSNKFCPYELASKKAHKADIIICDYNYMFASGVKEGFFGKIGRDLDECILIIDEAHNLPDRIRNSHSYKLNEQIIKNGLKELKDFVKSKQYDIYLLNLRKVLQDIAFEKDINKKEQLLIDKNEFSNLYISKFNDNNIKYEDIVEKLFEISKLVKEERIISYISYIASFLDRWDYLDEKSYLRIMETKKIKNEFVLSLEIRCIDPSELSCDILNNSYSSILMSATLNPANMYKDILGIENVKILELESPFKSENQLTLVIDDVTTKYSLRDDKMYEKYANHIENIVKLSNGRNIIIFFTSYLLMDKITSFINIKSLNSKIFKEERYMSKEEKENLVIEFKEKDNNKSSVLFAITSGSFAEGLDLPEEMLEIVCVIGLPLGVPDLFTKGVIKHFDKKFKKGQMYGYINPAMNKIIQASGRCIRTRKDKGIIILMDNRFAFSVYSQNFPKNWKLIKTNQYENLIIDFLKK